MKRFILILVLIFLSAKAALCMDFDYQKAYRDLDMPDFKYVHNIDPGQYFECKKYTWSPYPLFRLNSPLFFKKITIEPGYYILTPREQKGKNYMLFKESGLVKYIVPVYKKDFVPEFFYDEHLPKAKLSFGQKFQVKSYDLIGKMCPAAKRKPIPQTYLEVTDLDNNFISVVVYWQEFRYYMILRTVQL